MIAAANPARVSDDFHVGGVFSRRSRAVVRVLLLALLGCRRPTGAAARCSIVPAAVPRCLVRRLRFV